jgi:toxin ParE2
MISVTVRHLAEADVEGAQHWYAEKDPKLAMAFARDFTRTVDRIATMPDQFPEVGRQVRRALLHQFPYACYFLRLADHAVVIAVLHQIRKPGGWRDRARRETS